MHPLDGRANRRQFLRRSGGAALALSGASSVLSACTNSTEPVGGAPYPLARPDRPVTLPLWEKPIPSGLEPETGGTFTVFNYPEYIYGKLLVDFGKKYGVKVEVTPFNDINSGIAILASGSVSPDVTEMTPDLLTASSRPSWSSRSTTATSPTSPTCGTASEPVLRRRVPLLRALHGLRHRHRVPHRPRQGGHPQHEQPLGHLLAGPGVQGQDRAFLRGRETIAMALLRKGPRTSTPKIPKLVNQAVKDLQELYNICSIKVGDLQYQHPGGHGVAEPGVVGRHAGRLLLLPAQRDTGKLLRFWNPGYGIGPISNDAWCVCKTTKKPVLAHLFLNYMLDNGIAYANFVNFNGYQPPLKASNPATLVSKKVIPEALANSVLTEEDFGPTSLQEMTLSWRGQQLWQNAYAYFQAG